jgi:WhiB family redox-sensing transcriptional regulator
VTYTQRLPTPVAEAWDWQRLGACRGMDVQAFFHPTGERGAAARERERHAKQICSGCPVRPQCRAHALQVEEPYGTWGGLGERERWELIRKQRRLTRAATAPVPAPVTQAGPLAPEASA